MTTSSRRRGRMLAGAVLVLAVLGGSLVVGLGSRDPFQFLYDLGPRAVDAHPSQDDVSVPPTSATNPEQVIFAFTPDQGPELQSLLARFVAENHLATTRVVDGVTVSDRVDPTWMYVYVQHTRLDWEGREPIGTVRRGEWLVIAGRDRSWLEERVSGLRRMLHLGR